MGLWRRGTTSCGGSCRLFPIGDWWLAVSLPRADDMELVPAWLELHATPRAGPATWSVVGETLGMRDPDELVERAVLLGLPVARLGEAADAPAVVAERLGAAPARTPAACSSSISPLCGPVRSVGTCWLVPGPPW